MCREYFSAEELSALEEAFERASAQLGFPARPRPALAMLMFELAETGELDVPTLQLAAMRQMLHPN